MDPTQCYLEMFEAMQDGDFATARERALALRDCPLDFGSEPHAPVGSRWRASVFLVVLGVERNEFRWLGGPDGMNSVGYQARTE